MVGGGDVSLTKSVAQYGVSELFLDNLEALSRVDSWWRDVLLRDDVLLAVRRNSLNVYHRGASIFRVDDTGDGVSPKTHVKYLVRQQQALAELVNGAFKLAPTAVAWSHYEGPATLNDMLRSAADLAGPEKTGLHPLVLSNPRVIDVEVSLERAGNTDAGTSGDQDRIDAVTLEERDSTVWVVFHEAKHFSNPALRAKVGTVPAVVRQIRRYRATIEHHADALVARYAQVCRNLARLHAMRAKVRRAAPAAKPLAEISPLIHCAADTPVKLQIDPAPRLIVFGFDGDQKKGLLASHLDNLRQAEPGLDIYAVGNPTTAGGAFRPVSTVKPSPRSHS